METIASVFVQLDKLAEQGFIPFESMGQRFFTIYGVDGSSCLQTWFAYYRPSTSESIPLEAIRGPGGKSIVIKGDFAARKYNPEGGALGRAPYDAPSTEFFETNTELLKAIDAALPGEKLDPANSSRCRSCGK